MAISLGSLQSGCSLRSEEDSWGISNRKLPNADQLLLMVLTSFFAIKSLMLSVDSSKSKRFENELHVSRSAVIFSERFCFLAFTFFFGAEATGSSAFELRMRPRNRISG